MNHTTYPAIAIRPALRVDALASGGLGAITAAGAVLLAPLLGLPIGLLVGAGAFLVLFAGALLVLAARRPVPDGAAWAVVLVNVLWVVASVALVPMAAPTALGTAFLLAQALVVVGFAGWQSAALRRGAVPVAG
ncbi:MULTISPECIES: hypothetical protein [Pseudonocardia]|uniref:Integral membrane protein n=2 Tax=Pseudonocardia TaxID=1847 RepID=A0A1Y2N3R4_PSEAH|nr:MULTISPECIES: hypothetical protein [Pseudonocardia]OSY42114.1 hypothetical protein BG845_01610 [Pseudonocardia autotrophica]TDN75118.1 hypothetical protein C8E95_4261 [Pseudonocardia autotrophica]BBF99063.1 hypothetical protein Pdca_02730 [Pseudonocardia autotrophica]GEC23983.1 hypothetical protein PSA01_10120 [Pseudonocardia saturnea]